MYMSRSFKCSSVDMTALTDRVRDAIAEHILNKLQTVPRHRDTKVKNYYFFNFTYSGYSTYKTLHINIETLYLKK